jgi:hypothetical protein
MTELSMRLEEAVRSWGGTTRSLHKALERRPELHRKGTALSGVQRYMAGTHTPSLEFLFAVAEITGVREEWLVLGRGEMTEEQQRARHAAETPAIDARIASVFPEYRAVPPLLRVLYLYPIINRFFAIRFYSAQRSRAHLVTSDYGVGESLRNRPPADVNAPMLKGRMEMLARLEAVFAEAAPSIEDVTADAAPDDEELAFYRYLRRSLIEPLSAGTQPAWEEGTAQMPANSEDLSDYFAMACHSLRIAYMLQTERTYIRLVGYAASSREKVASQRRSYEMAFASELDDAAGDPEKTEHLKGVWQEVFGTTSDTGPA